MVPDVYVKVTKTRGETLVAVCDEELLGKTLVDEERTLSFKVGESFYKGLKMELKDSLEYVKTASIANLVGSKIVKAAISSRLVNPLAVIAIAGVPHAQIVKIR